MPHRHPPPTRSGPVIIALAVLLLVIAGGVLGAAYHFVVREEEKPPEPPEVGLDVPEQVIPFDQPTVDERTGAWVLEFEAQEPWREPGTVEAVLERARDCRDFVRDGRFARLYPEAPQSVRLRITCSRPLRGDTADRLRAGLAGIEGIEIELRGLDPAEFR